MRPLLLALALAATPALAEAPLSAEAFEANVTGMTITYQQAGQVFGIEEYLPGRKVRWSVAPGQCQFGIWYPVGEAICIVYEDDPTAHCWTFRLRGGVLSVLSTEAPPGAELTEIDRHDRGLACPGPDVGV